MISHLLKERMMNCWDDFSKNLANLKKHFDLRSRAFEACSFSAESTRSVPRVALFGNIEVDYEKICVKTTPYWFDSSNRAKFRPVAQRLSRLRPFLTAPRARERGTPSLIFNVWFL